MTSTPVSLNDESLNGSWIDINSASQIHSPNIDEQHEPSAPPRLTTDSVQNLGLISFQVERFLQEAQRNQNSNTSGTNNTAAGNNTTTSQQNLPQVTNTCADDNSDIYMSDTDVSIDGFDGKALLCSLRRHHQTKHHTANESNNNNTYPKTFQHQHLSSNDIANIQKLSKSGDLVDQLSDSLSLLSRASALDEPQYDGAADFQDFEWIWDWTAKPEYFTGQEWKVCVPKQDHLMHQRQLYYANLNRNHAGTLFSGEVMSLLVLTNILSIIIGAGLTYSILMRRSTM